LLYCLGLKLGRCHTEGETQAEGVQNRVLREIVGIKREEMTGEWRKLHNEELQDLYYSPNVIRAMQSRRMRWAGHVALVG